MNASTVKKTITWKQAAGAHVRGVTRTSATKMDTHLVETVASSKTPSVTVLLGNGSMEIGVETVLLDVRLVIVAEIVHHVQRGSTDGRTMTDVGTSAHSDTVEKVIVTFAYHVLWTIPFISSTSSHLRTDVKFGSTDQKVRNT